VRPSCPTGDIGAAKRRPFHLGQIGN